MGTQSDLFRVAWVNRRINGCKRNCDGTVFRWNVGTAAGPSLWGSLCICCRVLGARAELMFTRLLHVLGVVSHPPGETVLPSVPNCSFRDSVPVLRWPNHLTADTGGGPSARSQGLARNLAQMLSLPWRERGAGSGGGERLPLPRWRKHGALVPPGSSGCPGDSSLGPELSPFLQF